MREGLRVQCYLGYINNHIQNIRRDTSRPAEKFWVVTPQTSLKFLGQNLFGDQFWGQSEAGKV